MPRGAKPIRRARPHRRSPSRKLSRGVDRPCDDERGLRAGTLAVVSAASLLDQEHAWVSLGRSVAKLWHHYRDTFASPKKTCDDAEEGSPELAS